jgi:hypothetical protein
MLLLTILMRDGLPKLSWALLLFAAAAGFGFGPYQRSPLPAPSGTNGLTSPTSLTNPPLQRISEGVYGLGLVQFDKAKRTVRFPGIVNMVEGQVEYAVVHVTGKVHESVLKTQAAPYHVQLARLLVGAPEEGPADPNAAPDLVGPRIRIEVEWKLAGTVHRAELEDLVINTLTKKPMTRGDWVYNGSRVVAGTYLAQRDGSMVAIIADPDAMVNSPRPGRDNDDIWIPDRELVPPVGTPVDIILKLANEHTN